MFVLSPIWCHTSFMHIGLWITFGVFGLLSLLIWALVLHNVKTFADFQSDTFFTINSQEKLSVNMVAFFYSAFTFATLILIFLFLHLRYGW